MNKEEFISRLESSLDIFEDNIKKEEVEKYKNNKRKFLSITPGLTGYWAANGRSDTTYEQRMIMELYYIDNISFKLDLKVFFKTIIFARVGEA